MTIHYLGRRVFDGMWHARVRVTGVRKERDLSPHMMPDPITNNLYPVADQWRIADEALWGHIVWLSRYHRSGWCVGSHMERV